MRLIDADALIERINKLGYNNDDKKMEIAGNEVLHSYMPLIIQDALTAYDVEKVVEQVHTKFENYLDEIIDGKAKVKTLDFLQKQNKEICNLVRNGGKE